MKAQAGLSDRDIAVMQSTARIRWMVLQLKELKKTCRSGDLTRQDIEDLEILWGDLTFGKPVEENSAGS